MTCVKTEWMRLIIPMHGLKQGTGIIWNNSGDYDWYFGDSGYSFDKGGSNREEERSTGWPCGGSSHVFPDTGMKKSWCKWCGEEGEFMVTTGKYEAKAKSV